MGSTSSLRLFDDVSIHINEAVSLYVHSKRIDKLLEQLTTPDPNHNEVLYENQVQAELMDYVRMSYKKLEELSSSSSGRSRIDSVFAEREMLLKLNALLNKLVNSGELKNLLDKAWEQFSIENSRALILANTEIKLEKVRERRETRFRNFGLIDFYNFWIGELTDLISRYRFTNMASSRLVVACESVATRLLLYSYNHTCRSRRLYHFSTLSAKILDCVG